MHPQHLLALYTSSILAIGIPAALPAQHSTPLEGVWRFVEEVDRRADGSLIKTGPPMKGNGTSKDIACSATPWSSQDRGPTTARSSRSRSGWHG